MIQDSKSKGGKKTLRYRFFGVALMLMAMIVGVQAGKEGIAQVMGSGQVGAVSPNTSVIAAPFRRTSPKQQGNSFNAKPTASKAKSKKASTPKKAPTTNANKGIADYIKQPEKYFAAKGGKVTTDKCKELTTKIKRGNKGGAIKVVGNLIDPYTCYTLVAIGYEQKVRKLATDVKNLPQMKEYRNTLYAAHKRVSSLVRKNNIGRSIYYGAGSMSYLASVQVVKVRRMGSKTPPISRFLISDTYHAARYANDYINKDNCEISKGLLKELFISEKDIFKSLSNIKNLSIEERKLWIKYQVKVVSKMKEAKAKRDKVCKSGKAGQKNTIKKIAAKVQKNQKRTCSSTGGFLGKTNKTTCYCTLKKQRNNVKFTPFNPSTQTCADGAIYGNNDKGLAAAQKKDIAKKEKAKKAAKAKAYAAKKKKLAAAAKAAKDKKAKADKAAKTKTGSKDLKKPKVKKVKTTPVDKNGNPIKDTNRPDREKLKSLKYTDKKWQDAYIKSAKNQIKRECPRGGNCKANIHTNTKSLVNTAKKEKNKWHYGFINKRKVAVYCETDRCVTYVPKRNGQSQVLPHKEEKLEKSVDYWAPKNLGVQSTKDTPKQTTPAEQTKQVPVEATNDTPNTKRPEVRQSQSKAEALEGQMCYRGDVAGEFHGGYCTTTGRAPVFRPKYTQDRQLICPQNYSAILSGNGYTCHYDGEQKQTSRLPKEQKLQEYKEYKEYKEQPAYQKTDFGRGQQKALEERLAKERAQRAAAERAIHQRDAQGLSLKAKTDEALFKQREAQLQGIDDVRKQERAKANAALLKQRNEYQQTLNNQQQQAAQQQRQAQQKAQQQAAQRRAPAARGGGGGAQQRAPAGGGRGGSEGIFKSIMDRLRGRSEKDKQKPTFPTIVAKPQCASFTADKIKIESGEEITMEWAVTGANKIIITPQVRVVEVSDGKGGKKRVAKANPKSSVKYILIATNEKGEEHRCETKRIAVQAKGGTDPEAENTLAQCKDNGSKGQASISITPNDIERADCDPEQSGEECDAAWEGKEVKVAWKASCVESCTLSGPDGLRKSGVEQQDELIGMLRKTSTFAISCEDALGNTIKKEATATVKKP